MHKLSPRPLTAQAFARFGEVIEASPQAERLAINYGRTERFNDLANLDLGVDGGRAIVSIFRSRPLEPPVLRIFERHPLGSQAFVPLQARPFLVAVAPPGDFDPGRVEVFRAAPRQGVNYARGVWHHFCLALGGESDFLVIDRAGPGDNLDEVVLAEPDWIEVTS